MISISQKGDFITTEAFLNRVKNSSYLNEIEKVALEGVLALAMATPIDSGETASSWDYEIHCTKGETSIIWTNDNMNDGVNIAIILQYGHVTRNGGFVKGIDYINPAMRPIFEKLADTAWKEVTRK